MEELPAATSQVFSFIFKWVSNKSDYVLHYVIFSPYIVLTPNDTAVTSALIQLLQACFSLTGTGDSISTGYWKKAWLIGT